MMVTGGISKHQSTVIRVLLSVAKYCKLNAHQMGTEEINGSAFTPQNSL